VSLLGGLVVLSDRTGICKARMHEAGAAALKEAADELLQIATPDVPVAPVGGGFLRDSGKVEVDEAGPSAQVGYTTGPGSSDGRARVPSSIAVMVHEDTTAKHSTGHAKFLETAAKENAKRLGVTIGVSIKEKMG